MKVIKTPTGMIPVDDPAKLLTQAQYDALSDTEKNKGTYYIIDDGNGVGIGQLGDVIGIVGNTDITGIGDGTITNSILYLYNEKTDKTDLDVTNKRIDTNYNKINELASTVNTNNSIIKELKMGVRNIALNTNSGKSNWGWNAGDATVSVEDYPEDPFTYVKFTLRDGMLPENNIIHFSNINIGAIKKNQKYVMSFQVYADIQTAATVALEKIDGSNPIMNGASVEFSKVNEWVKVTIIFTPLEDFYNDNQSLCIHLNTTVNIGDYFIIKDFQITNGNIEGDWSLAPEDILSKIKAGGSGGGSEEGGGSGTIDQDLNKILTDLQTKTTNNANNISELINSKANKTDLATFSTSITELSTNKADKTDLDNLSLTVSNNTDTIESLRQTKANSSDINSIINDIDYLTSYKATKADLDNYKLSNDTKVIANTNDIMILKSDKASQTDLNTCITDINTLKTTKANKSDLDALIDNSNAAVVDINMLYANITEINNVLETKAEKTSLESFQNDIASNTSKIGELETSKADLYKLNEISAQVVTNTENIALKANIADIDNANALIANNASAILELSTNKANQSEVNTISERVSIVNTSINAINNRMYYSSSSADTTELYITTQLDLTNDKGCILAFGAADTDTDTIALVINVRYGKVCVNNLGSIKTIVSIEENKIKVENVTNNTRLFVIEV